MASCYENITVDDFNRILTVCAGLPLSRVWRSIDPTVFLELGRLTKPRERKGPMGQITCMFECDWRIEKRRSIEIGSGFRTKQIDKRLAAIVGVSIGRVEILDFLPEVLVTFRDGRRLRTFTNWNKQPAWSIGFKDLALFPMNPLWKGIDVTPWVHTRAGRIEVEYCYDDTKKAVRAAVRRMGFI